MRRLGLVLLLLFPLACAPDTPQEPDHQSEWRTVLEQKKAAAARASTETRQAYADSLAAFVRKHPHHSRAREVYHRVQLEFADELIALGRHQDAIRFYRSVLTHDARNAEAQRGLTDAAEKLAITQEKLEKLEKGMSHREVAGLLGRPIPGWTLKKQHRGLTVEAWYYRTTAGGIAGVYFRDGEVFAAESNSDAPLGL